jgi:hypothetical protein
MPLLCMGLAAVGAPKFGVAAWKAIEFAVWQHQAQDSRQDQVGAQGPATHPLLAQ